MIFNIIYFTIASLLTGFKPEERDYIAVILSLMQQIEILERQKRFNNRSTNISSMNKHKLAALHKLSGAVKHSLKIISPGALTKWAKNKGKKICAKHKNKRNPGRPPVTKETKNLILSMKNDNLRWGAGKIQGELLKLGIPLDQSTIKRILAYFRRKGKIKKDPANSWSKFIKNQAASLFAMDFITLDTLRGIRYYILFFIKVNTREIVHFNISTNPDSSFINRQLMTLTWDTWPKGEEIYLIHDNDIMFDNISFENFNIRNVPISPRAPNMNAIAERFVRSLRQEALDHFIILNQKQLRNIVKRYLDYYNRLRPHQGINQQTPKGYTPNTEGTITAEPVMSGLYHHYHRKAS